MTILLVLIPLGLVLLGAAIAAFVWAVRHGQFEDLKGEGARILFDEETRTVTQDNVRPSQMPEGDRCPKP